MRQQRKRVGRGLLERLGALLMSGIFVYGGYEALREPGGRAGKAEKLGLPAGETLVRLNGALMVLGGTALAVGKRPKLAAVALIGSLIRTTVAGHRFWEERDPKGRSMQLVKFLENLGLIGGLLILLSKRRTVSVPSGEDL